MKKLSLLFIAITLALAAVFGTVFTACDDEDETKFEYSVTVYNEDMVTPVSDVTVKWSRSGKESASAKTDANGKATASLAAGTYDVTLHDLPAGMESSEATVTAGTRDINLVIKKSQVDYTVTVTKSDSTPADGVTVTWSSGNTIAGTATTGSDGKASKTLVYGDYSVTVSNLPAGNVYVGSKQVTGAQPNAEFALSAGENVNFSVTLKSEGGLLFKEYTLNVCKAADNEQVQTVQTDDNGKATFSLSSEFSYKVTVENVPKGYTYDEATLSVQNKDVEIILHSSVITDKPSTEYVIGDIIYDYEFTTPYQVDGAKLTYKISEILKEKKAIVLNFWGINCSACVLEMPAMEEAYAKYKDDVEILAISNYMGGDSESSIVNYRETNGYTYPMFRDTHNFISSFALAAWPTNVIIDRYGAIANIEEGALTSVSFWEKLLNKYVADDYTQTFTPGQHRSESTVVDMARPDVEVPEGHYENVGNTINATLPEGCSINWYGEPEETAEFTWPFLLKDTDDGKVLYPSNSGHDSTYSFIYADITMTAGKVFAFDYLVQSEAEIDHFYILFDGNLIYQISGNNENWQTCYLYLDIVSGKHQLALSYIKDADTSVGIDGAYIKNARFVDADSLNDQSISILRPAAYGTPEENATSFPYYAGVAKGEDGYYHVDISTLQNSQFAGKDEHPMLFANLANATVWSNKPVSEFVFATDETTGEYLYDLTFSYLGKTDDYRGLITDYLSLADKSDLTGFLPVTEQLKELLIAFTAHISKTDSHANEWLELCYYYSVYGTAEPVGNPIIGLTEETAIEITEGTTVTANLTRNIQPYPISIYTFTPNDSGIYEIESFISDDKANIYASQIWIYDGETSINKSIYESGTERLNRDGINEQNFDVNIYLTKGHKYYIAVAFLMSERGNFDFKVTNTGKQSVVVLDSCASVDYVMDDENNMALRRAVDYAKDNDGYYHVKYSDGTLGDYIYVDFKYATPANTYNPLSQIINQYVVDPLDSDIKYFKVFDFRKSIVYATVGYGEDGLPIYNYAVDEVKNYDSEHAADYIDYTEKMRNYCEQALANTGREEGFVKANDELVKILTLYHCLRADSIYDGVMPKVIENEWLRFCWYYKTVDADHPV